MGRGNVGAEEMATRWCILRTSGGKTLALAKSLGAAGFHVWTPKRTLKRPAPGKRRTLNGPAPMIEVDAPILPTFVFARAIELHSLASIPQDRLDLHPAFSIFRHAGRIPLVGDRDIIGLRAEEREAAELIERLRECEDREARRKIRAAAARSDRARRKAMRAEHRDFACGAKVDVAEMPAMVGMTGVVESSNGKSAVVVFGGALKMTIEAWRLSPHDIEGTSIAA